jgi:hypothetical protein
MKSFYKSGHGVTQGLRQPVYYLPGDSTVAGIKTGYRCPINERAVWCNTGMVAGGRNGTAVHILLQVTRA